MRRPLCQTTSKSALGALLLALAIASCGKTDFWNWGGSDADAGLDSDSESDWVSLFEAVDILLVVDNSESMDEEQMFLGTSQFTLINGLVNPLPTAGLVGGLDDVRVAVISTDLGLSWGGQPYEEGDGWPTTTELPCSPSGDNGVFQSYGPDKQIKIKDQVIACDASNAQCPSGWTCEGIGSDGVGSCTAPGGETTIDCPWLTGDWAQTPSPTQVPNPDVATQVACLTSLGIHGCGFEQHLESADRALTRADQQSFVRDEALLAVLLVSDEDDCSIETKSFFYCPEIQDESQLEVNIACGENPEYLYPAAGYRQAFIDTKGGNPNAVMFAAVVGVPISSACQGWGDEIQGCLEHEAMQHEHEIINDPVPGMVHYKPACTRQVGDTEVTRANPARRIVELALEFGSRGYVFSICSDDWSKAMNELAAKIPLKSD